MPPLVLDESRADPMEGLEVLRLDPCDRHTAPGGPGHGFTAGCRITGIVLRRLHVRVDEVRGDEPHVMARLANTPGPVVGTPARFHAPAERRKCRNKAPHLTPGEAFPEPDSPWVIHANHVKPQLG